jgi:hypothetical protein
VAGSGWVAVWEGLSAGFLNERNRSSIDVYMAVAVAERQCPSVCQRVAVAGSGWVAVWSSKKKQTDTGLSTGFKMGVIGAVLSEIRCSAPNKVAVAVWQPGSVAIWPKPNQFLWQHPPIY